MMHPILEHLCEFFAVAGTPGVMRAMPVVMVVMILVVVMVGMVMVFGMVVIFI
ncbi:MAG: hypothetical protein AB7W37_07505 [Syntrophobacteraceae bacterium]